MTPPSTTPATSERDIFLEALERTDPAERTGFLNQACGRDAALRRRVEELLREHETLGSFLETPALQGSRLAEARPATTPGTTANLAATTEKIGDHIGPYKLLQVLGEGGCGVVYLAEQEQPVRRQVALKIIKLGMDTRQVIARFEAERQALAMMDHPNIAKVLDGGATETGRPYFVMEMVRGVRITEYCDRNKLSTEARLDLFLSVCHAIQHAHQKGIIHRDIKPSNILVTLHDSKPVPLVIDFGIAKATHQQRLTDKTLVTALTQFIGTPAYMSPEQIEMCGLDIDTRSDIYSLGVLLYELLTGKTPFDPDGLLRAGLDECRRTICQKEPPRPSTRVAAMLDTEMTATASRRRTEAPKLIHSLRGDLDWIAMKCLEKDRARRYPTANDLATDIQNFLNGDPVQARPPSSLYRFQKAVRRHRGAFAAAAAVAAALLAGAGISAWQAVRATQAEYEAEASQIQEAQLRRQAERGSARAREQTALARLNEYVADINLAQQSLAAGNFGRAVQLLDKHRSQPVGPDLRGFEWRYLWRIAQGDDHESLPTGEEAVAAIAFSPNSASLAVGSSAGLGLWDLPSKSLSTQLPQAPSSLVFSPDGKTLFASVRGNILTRSMVDGSMREVLHDHFGPLSLSGDGERLATTSRHGIHVWDTSTWEEVRSFPNAFAPLALSRGGRRLVAATQAGLVIWSLDDRTPELLLHDSTNITSSPGLRFGMATPLAFSPDGLSVVAAQNTRSAQGVFVLRIWDARSGEELAAMPEDPEHIEHTGVISCLAFSPDGKTLATASLDHSIRLWDFPKRQLLATLHSHLHEVWALAFSPDGQELASGARDGGVKLWPAYRQLKQDVLPGPWQPLAFSKDSRVLAAWNGQATVTFFNTATFQPEQEFPLESRRFGPAPRPSLSENLEMLAEGLPDGRVKLWQTRTRKFTTLRIPEGRVGFLALSPNGWELITGGFRQPVRWWDLRARTNSILATQAQRVLFSPDGGTLATFARNEPARIWNAVSRSLRTTLAAEHSSGFAAAFSLDGRMLATTADPSEVDDAIRLWDTWTGKLLGTYTGHMQPVFSAAFSPDGRTLASAGDDSTLKLWNVASGQELLSIRRLGGALSGLMFSPDGTLLAGAKPFFLPSPELRFHRAPPLAEIDDATTRTASRK